MADANLTRARIAHFDVFHHELLGATVGVDAHGAAGLGHVSLLGWEWDGSSEGRRSQ